MSGTISDLQLVGDGQNWSYIRPSTWWRRSEMELFQTFNFFLTVRIGTIAFKLVKIFRIV
jgi:hypothetical protein